MLPDLTSQTIAREALSAEDKDAMYALFAQYYTGHTPDLFLRDLGRKNWVILLRDENGRLRGFSTFLLYTTMAAGDEISVVYSGDTLIEPAYWGTPVLQRSWVAGVLRLSAAMPQPLYWLLISSGYKTYRFLPVFFKEFYPRYDRSTPPAMKALLDHLAFERFGAEYDAAAGVVRFQGGATPLRDGVAEITSERLRNPHVAFFAEHNPGHIDGDELVCLTQIHPDNFTAAGQRMLG